MKIRSAMVEDYEQVMKLYTGLVGEDRFSEPGHDSFAEIQADPSVGLFVAEFGGELIGVASVSMRQVVRYKQPIAQLDELFVDENARKHGAGRALLDAVENFAREHGCYRLYIESGWQHEGGHAFYQRLDYDKDGYYFKKDLLPRV